MNQTLVVFKIGHQQYCVNILKVKEIYKTQETVVLPNKPSFVEGVINLRGDVLCIINLAKKLNTMSLVDMKNQKVIIVEIDSIPVGFLVDEVVGIKHIDDATIDSTPKVVANEGDFVDSIVKTEDSMIISIDLERVLNINELKALDNFNKENSR